MLKVESSCEIDDIIGEVCLVSGKKYNEVEKAFSQLSLYPESRKTFITTQFGPVVDREGYEWLNDALMKILTDLKLQSLYITYPI